jgi:hypothetical protein
MVELSNQPFTIKMTGDVVPSEVDLRLYIDLSWCNGVIFNAAVVEHGQRLLEYDAVLWDDTNVLFVEYKKSVNAYKAMSAKRINQVKSISQTVARRLGFANYQYIIVVRGMTEESERGCVDIVGLSVLEAFHPKFETSKVELAYIERQMEKLERNNQKDETWQELKKIKDMMLQWEGS